MARILIGLLFLAHAAAVARDLDKLYRKDQFKLGEHKFFAYVADDDSKRAEGLMFVKKLPADVGMLFIFDELRPQSFWMKNTLIPLSIGFFDEKGVLIDIQEMSVANSLLALEIPSYQSRGPALFALEMNAGWFARHHIKKQARLQLVGKSSSAKLRAKLPE